MSRYAGGAVAVLLGLAVLFWSHDFVGAPYVSNDSVQYLDAAAHLAAGDCFCTTVAHFDEQIAVGHIPVPFMHFAPGYPLLIAGLSRLGLAPETAGYLISAFSYLLTIALFWYIGTTLGAHPWALGSLCLLWIANSIAILMASFVATEALFTAIFLGLAALMVADSKTETSRPWILVAIGIIGGAAYWVRFAGIFVVPVAVLYLVWRWWTRRRTLAPVLLGLAAAGGECLAVMIRNSLVTGTWRGGFSNNKGHSGQFILGESARALYHLPFGDRAVAHLDVWAIAFAGTFAAAGVLAVIAWRGGRRAELPSSFSLSVSWLGVLAGVYVAGLIYAVRNSVASDLARFFIPVYALVLVVAAAASLARKTMENIILSVLVLTVLAIQARSLLTRPAIPLTASVSRVFKEEVEPGISVQRWLSGHVSPKDVVIATNGQAVHYVLQRPVVAVIDPDATTRRIDEAGFHALMAQYGARYMVLFPGSNLVQEQDDIPFLRSLAAGSVPPWLDLAAKTRDVALYECPSCVK